MKLPDKLSTWLKPRLRLWKMYNELGYIPWHRLRKAKKETVRKGVYIGTREAIPFMNDDAKRTLSHLLLRPGYMMRDYIMRGQHERYLAPFTALLVFYSVFSLIMAVVRPGASDDSLVNGLIRGIRDAATEVKEAQSEPDDSKITLNDSTIIVSGDKLMSIGQSIQNALLLTRLDLNPDAVDTPWKASLAAIEGDLRSKGIPLFLGNFLLLWLAMAIVLRKYKIGFSGAAAASAYLLCQFCIFMFIALLLSFGHNSELGLLLMGLLLFIDYRQMLSVGTRPAIRLTIKTGLWYLLEYFLVYIIIGGGILLFALSKV